jgi:hypothetical protein
MMDLMKKVLDSIAAMTDAEILEQMLDSAPFQCEMELLQAELDRREAAKNDEFACCETPHDHKPWCLNK